MTKLRALRVGLLAGLGLVGLVGGASGQVGGMYWQCVAPSSSNANGGYCPVGTTYPLPISGVVVVSPASPASALAPVVSASAEASHVIKTSALGVAFYDAYVTTGATAGFLLVLDATTDPGNGAVGPKHCIEAPANSTVGYSTDGMPAEKFTSGVVVVFSTTGCFTETTSATAFFHARAN